MHIEFTEEQTMLRDSSEKFLLENYSFDKRQHAVKKQQGLSPEFWQQFAELGWLGMPFSEEDGGFGGGALETMLLCENIGKYQVVEPFISTVIIAGGILANSGSAELKEKYLEGIIDGSIQGALAHTECGNTSLAFKCATTARETVDGFKISGKKHVVRNGPHADVFLVTAVVGNAVSPSLFAIPADALGLSTKDYGTYDGKAASDVFFDNVEVDKSALVGERNRARQLLIPVLQRAILAVSAEAVGAMDALVKGTVEYTRQRKQFGKPISEFQVLRHRMVNMFMETELTRSLMLATAWHLDNKSPDAEGLVYALKAKVGKAGPYVAQSAIQLHGGIGTTDELNIGHYFKRITVIENLFGSRSFHLKRYADLGKRSI